MKLEFSNRTWISIRRNGTAFNNDTVSFSLWLLSCEYSRAIVDVGYGTWLVTERDRFIRYPG